MARVIVVPEQSLRSNKVEVISATVDPLLASTWVDLVNVAADPSVYWELVLLLVAANSFAGSSEMTVELLSGGASIYNSGALKASNAQSVALGDVHVATDGADLDVRARGLLLPDDIQVRAQRDDYGGPSDTFDVHAVVIGHSR